jgi:hypothetical protein
MIQVTLDRPPHAGSVARSGSAQQIVVRIIERIGK